MGFNDTTYYSYYYKLDKFGFSVCHKEDNVDVWDYSFARESDARAYAMRLNNNESRRVEEAKARLETSKKTMVIPSNPYYSLTGYYGD